MSTSFLTRQGFFHLCNNESSWQTAHVLLNGTPTPRSKVLFKQRWRDTRECLWGRMKELDGGIESNQCRFVLCTTFTQWLFRSRSICEENTWIKFNYSEAELQNAVAVSVSAKDNRSSKDISALLNAKPCSCMKLYTPWPLHKINFTPTHVSAVCLIYTYMFQQHLHPIIYPGALGPR